MYVEALSQVRGPAREAARLYRETDESQVLRERAAAIRRLAMEPASTITQGRPTKRNARKLREFQNSF